MKKSDGRGLQDKLEREIIDEVRNLRQIVKDQELKISLLNSELRESQCIIASLKKTRAHTNAPEDQDKTVLNADSLSECYRII